MHDEERLRPARQAGLRADRTHIPDLIAILQEKPTPTRFLMETTLHSLAQLGAVEALPAVDNFIQDSKNFQNLNYAKVARARLIAENNAAGITDGPTLASAKITRFYQELGVSAQSLNAAVTAETGAGRPPQGHPETSVAIYALREIADMIYHGVYADYASLPGVTALDFSKDQAAMLKIKLSPMTQKDRIASLINQLAATKVLDNYYGIQLAADEGKPASDAAAAKLREMQLHQGDYSANGFVALLLVLHGVGDKEQLPLVTQLMDPYNVAFIYPDIKNGAARQLVPGY